jgi:hypothetical protein
MYDYYLGGTHNFPIDRQAAEAVIALSPDAAIGAQLNRAFLGRAVEFLCAQGIDQFLDIGSGMPTSGNVHEIAQAVNPQAKVIYVDVDPVTVLHSQAILRINGVTNAAAIQGDMRQPEQVLSHPDVQNILDFNRPVAVLLVAILHFVPDDTTAAHIMQQLHATVTPGSYFAISHATSDHIPPELLAKAEAIYAKSTNPLRFRPSSEIKGFFDGMELVDPGVVYVPRWRPRSPDDTLHDQPERSAVLAGVARKT